MKDKILFSEQQRFRQIWLWAIIIITIGSSAGVFLHGLIQQVVLGIPFGDRPMSDTGVIIAFNLSLGFAVIFVMFFVKMRLETEITAEGVKIRFFPFHLSFCNYKWEDISEAVVKKYSPMKYGGWGIRGKWGWGLRIGTGVKLNMSNDKVYSVSGNQALHLQFKNGKRLLIGTQKTYELEKALKKVEQIKKENQLNIM